MRPRPFIILFVSLTIGCAKQTLPNDRHLLLFVPGAAGDGVWYDGMKDALPTKPAVYHWGHGGPLFFMNFSDESTHTDAENTLADLLDKRTAEVPGSTIQIVGHSAGCGVILGALKKTKARIADVVLLAPSVSPRYELGEALRQVDGQVHIFVSDQDDLFLNWRASHFGTYDRVKTPAAGHAGFDVSRLSALQRSKIHEYPYKPEWNSLGNDGGHFGTIGKKFVEQMVTPLLNPQTPATTRSPS